MKKNQVEQLRIAVTGYLSQYEELLREAKMELQADQLEQKIAEFRQGLFQVLFTGVFTAGKSTILNALMRQKILFVSINPATPVIIRIINGTDSNIAVITFRDENRPEEKMTIEEFARKYRLDVTDSEKYREIKYVTIQRKLPTENIIFADSPGLENTNNDNEVANEFAEKADAIVFMLNATKAMGQNEREYVRKNFERRGLRNIFIVVNWYNMVQPQEEEEFKRKIAFDLHDVFVDESGKYDEELFKSRVFYVDALTSECARTRTSKQIRKGVRYIEVPILPEEDQYTGIPEFEKALYDFLQSSDKDKIGYRGYMPRMAAMYKATSQSVEKFAEDSAKDLMELREERNAQQKAIDELNRKIDDISRAFDNAIREIMMNANTAYGAFTTSVSNNWNDYFEDSDIKFGAKEITKIGWLKTKYKFQDIFGRGDSDEQKEIELVREQSFQEIMKPIGDAIEEYIKLESEKMTDQIVADSEETIERLAKDIERYCMDINDINLQGLNIQKILNNIAGCGNVNTSMVSEDINLAQVLISSVLFYNVDDAIVDIVGGGQPWGEYLKRTIMKELQDVILSIVIQLFTGVGWIYYLARVIWGIFTVSSKTGEYGKKMLLGSKDATVQALLNQRDEVAAKMEKKFAKKLHNNCLSFTNDFKAQLEQTQAQLDNLIQKLEQGGLDREQELEKLENVKNRMVDTFNELAVLIGDSRRSEEDILQYATERMDVSVESKRGSK